MKEMSLLHTVNSEKFHSMCVDKMLRLNTMKTPKPDKGNGQLDPFVKLCNFLTHAFATCKTKLTLNLNFKSIVKKISFFFSLSID